LTGVKPGKLELQSATQSFLVSTPFGMRNAPGFIDPTEAFQQQVIDVKTNGASIDIKPLPSAGRPPSFSGAVGDFTLSTSAQPPKARTGDPVSMKVEIKGLGNFDRIEQPTLTNTEGWRAYQATEETQSLDDLGLSAIKTFSFPLVPAQPVNSLPTVEFSYFDPNAEKYVTLKSSPIRIEIEGERLADLTASPTGQSAPPPVPQSDPPPTLDVLDIRTRMPETASFLPLVEQPAFWIGQTIPAGALLLLGLGLWVRNARITNEPRRILDREKRSLWKKIEASESRPEILRAAVRLLELNSHSRTGRATAGSLSLAEVIREERFPEDLRGDVQRLLEVREASIYGHVGSDSVTEDERSRIKTILNRWKSTS
jgi:hypothetical protein